MSSSSGGGTRSSSNASAAAATSGSSKRSSPLNYFSLDIPASLLGSSSASASSPGATSNSSLPHQSCSLPFVARLVRTPSSSSSTSGHGAGDSPHQDHQHHFQQVKDIKEGRWLPIFLYRKRGKHLTICRWRGFCYSGGVAICCYLAGRNPESSWLFFLFIGKCCCSSSSIFPGECCCCCLCTYTEPVFLIRQVSKKNKLSLPAGLVEIFRCHQLM